MAISRKAEETVDGRSGSVRTFIVQIGGPGYAYLSVHKKKRGSVNFNKTNVITLTKQDSYDKITFEMYRYFIAPEVNSTTCFILL